MRLGVCGRKFPEAARLGPERVLDRVAELGFEGVFFRSILDLDSRLDAHHLRNLCWQASHPDLSAKDGVFSDHNVMTDLDQVIDLAAWPDHR